MGASNVKWLLYQLLMAGLVIIFIGVLEYISRNRVIHINSGEWTTVISSNSIFIVIGVIVTFIYLIFLFEAKKEKSFFNHKVWNNMPKISGIVGVASIFLFILGGLGTINSWVEQWRSLLYIFLVYFLFLIFLFIFSFEHKKQRVTQHNQKAIHLVYLWTLLLFLFTFFLF